MSQRDENVGRLNVKKDQAVKLALRIHYLRGNINSLTDRNRKREPADAQNLQVLTEDYSNAQADHAKLCAEIRALCEDLGEKMPDLS